MSFGRVLSAVRNIFWIVAHTVLGYLRCVTPSAFLPKKELSKETVLITGAGSGIGRELAKHLSKYGCKLVLWDINAEGNEETQEIITGSSSAVVYTYTVDVTNRDLVYSTADKVRREVGDVTILINNAGIVNLNGVTRLPDKHIEKCLQINTISHFWTVKAFLPSMIDNNHGHIVGIASVLGLIAMPTLSAYCSSKSGAIGFMESMDLELKFMEKNITVTKVCLGVVDTPLSRNAVIHEDEIVPVVAPTCQPEYVADRIVNAIRTNEELLMCPLEVYAIVFAKRFLPTRAYYHLLALLNVELKDWLNKTYLYKNKLI